MVSLLRPLSTAWSRRGTEEDQEVKRDPLQLSNEMDVQISFATLGPDGLMGWDDYRKKGREGREVRS